MFLFPQLKSGPVEPPSTPPAKYSPLESRDSSPVGPRFQTPVQQRQPVATPVSGNSSLQNMDVVNMMEQLSKTVTKEVTAGVAGVAEQFASSLASMQKSNSQDEDTHMTSFMPSRNQSSEIQGLRSQTTIPT